MTLTRRKPIRRRSKKADSFARELAEKRHTLLQMGCQYLGCYRPAEVVHHRLMRSHGGLNDWGNLLPVCNRHHKVIHDRPEQSYAAGYLLRGVR